MNKKEFFDYFCQKQRESISNFIREKSEKVVV